MSSIRKFFDSPKGQFFVGAFILVVVAVMVTYAIHGYFRQNAPDSAYYTTYICTETGKSFRHRNQIGETLPILSPYSGKNTGIPAEACYWTADGKIKDEPTWVLLNEAVGKNEPTFCPDCGRLVVGHNPIPHEGSRPPPTADEYRARRSAPRASKDSASREDR